MEPSPSREGNREGIEQLRKLLLQDPEALSEVLPEAVVMAGQRDRRLAKAISPPVEEALQESIRRNPKSIAEVLFPVIGPAIRKAVASALRGMQEALNAALEKSVSAKAMRWRFEAARSGLPYAQVVMAHTLQFRVTHVLLIHAESGLLLAHVAAAGEPQIEAELTSGMMQAILAFGRESFGGGKGEELDQLQIGDFKLLVENGPRAMLAVSVQGYPSPSLKTAMADALESIHLEFADPLRTFAGETDVFGPARSVLESCVIEEKLERAPAPGGEPARRKRRAALAAALILLLLIPAVLYLRLNAQWTAYARALRKEPGVIVLASGREGLHYFVRGLHDPLARDPEILRREAGLPAARVEEHWDSHASGAPAFVLARARRILSPPLSVRLTYEAGVVGVVGEAGHAWIESARKAEPLLPAGALLSFERTIDLDRARVAAILAGVPPEVRFTAGARLTEEGRASLSAAAGRIREAAALAPAAGQKVFIVVEGATDPTGSEDHNRALRRRRAERVKEILKANGVPEDLITVQAKAGAGVRAVGLRPAIIEAPSTATGGI